MCGNFVSMLMLSFVDANDNPSFFVFCGGSLEGGRGEEREGSLPLVLFV